MDIPARTMEPALNLCIFSGRDRPEPEIPPRKARFHLWRAFLLVTVICGAAAQAQSVRYRVENLVFGVPDVYQNPRNLHEFVVDFANCSVRFFNQTTTEGRQTNTVSVCRKNSRLIIKAAVPGYTVDYDWTFRDEGRTIAGVWRDNSGFGASVGEMISYSSDPTPPVAPPSGTGIAGTWAWVSGQVLQVNADGTFQVLLGNSKINEGRWVNLSGGQYRLTHNSGGYVDTVTLSGDSNSLDGTNNLGYHVHGTRQGGAVPGAPSTRAISPVGTWNWVMGQTLNIAADNTFEVWQGTSKINDGRWESLGGQQYRLTHRSGGWVDTVTVSSDGMSMNGVNNTGQPVQGTRR
jgi:hypothetical protein